MKRALSRMTLALVALGVAFAAHPASGARTMNKTPTPLPPRQKELSVRPDMVAARNQR